jgi:hypothetical protein
VKVSEVEDSEDDEGKEPSAKRVKSRSVIEDSSKEGDWLRDREDRPKKDMSKVKVAEEVWAISASLAEVQEEVEKDKGKGKAKEARKVRMSERAELMKEMVLVVRELGSKVDRFVDEVRASNVLRNRADREYLEEQRRDYMERLRIARDLRGEESGEDLVQG